MSNTALLKIRVKADDLEDRVAVPWTSKHSWALQQLAGGCIPKLVLTTLADMSNQAGVCYGRVSRIEAATEATEKQIRAALKTLQERELLEFAWVGEPAGDFLAILNMAEGV